MISLSTSSRARRVSTEGALRYLRLSKSLQFKCTSQKLFFAMDQRTCHEGESGIGQKDGVIIVDHGSRRKESNLLLSNLLLASVFSLMSCLFVEGI